MTDRLRNALNKTIKNDPLSVQGLLDIFEQEKKKIETEIRRLEQDFMTIERVLEPLTMATGLSREELLDVIEKAAYSTSTPYTQAAQIVYSWEAYKSLAQDRKAKAKNESV